jgi:hypothetical protein
MAAQKRRPGAEVFFQVRPAGRSLERQAVAEYVAGLGKDYQQDHNALWAWLALAECLQAGLAPPEWALRYLTCAASAVRQLTRQPKPPNASAIAEALGLARAPGKRSVFQELLAVRGERGLAARVWARALSLGPRDALAHDRIPAPRGMADAAIIAVAAEASVSPARVWRAWQRYGATLAAGKRAEKL